MGETGARRRVLDAATAVMGHAGYRVHLTAIMKRAGVPAGSSCHYVPAGRDHLVDEVIKHRRAALQGRATCAAAESVDAEGFLRCLVRAHRAELEQSTYTFGCPLAGLITTGSMPDELRAAVADAMTQWGESIADVLRVRGAGPVSARATADQVVALLQGATLLGRAMRSSVPFEVLDRALPCLIQSSGSAAAEVA
jgi:TetR/AcrR family transcriptional regulator, lmrAB and yxaGH operons repressor